MPKKKYGRDLSGVEIGGTVDPFIGQEVESDLKIIRKIRKTVNTMHDKSYFETVKFSFIIIFRYGEKTDVIPKNSRVDRHGCLGLYLMLDVEIMRWCDKNDLDLMKEIFLIGTCEAVLHVLRKYKLPTEPVETLRAQYGDIPLTIEECEARSAQLKAEAISS